MTPSTQSNILFGGGKNKTKSGSKTGIEGSVNLTSDGNLSHWIWKEIAKRNVQHLNFMPNTVMSTSCKKVT